MHIEQIKSAYERHGVKIAEISKIFPNQWSANSQYGYTLDFFDDQESAENYVFDYYKTRMNLINQ